MARFAGRFFGRAADDPIVAKLWAAATMAKRARSHADLGPAATDFAEAPQLVGLDRWQRILADAGQRAADTVAEVRSDAPVLTESSELRGGAQRGSAASNIVVAAGSKIPGLGEELEAGAKGLKQGQAAVKGLKPLLSGQSPSKFNWLSSMANPKLSAVCKITDSVEVFSSIVTENTRIAV